MYNSVLDTEDTFVKVRLPKIWLMIGVITIFFVFHHCLHVVVCVRYYKSFYFQMSLTFANFTSEWNSLLNTLNAFSMYFIDMEV